MVKLVLYGIEASAPCRTVLLTLNALGLDYEFKEVNLITAEHKSEEFIKKNPQQTVPVLDDDGHFLWDSHAIAAYLVRKYAKNDDLYPKDFYKRAVVDQRLHFESGVLFASMRNITVPLFHKNQTHISQEKIDAVYDAYNFLEAFLKDEYLAGNTITIADFSAMASVSSFGVLVPLDPAKTPKVIAWINRLSKLPYYQKANAKGISDFAKKVNMNLGKN